MAKDYKAYSSKKPKKNKRKTSNKRGLLWLVVIVMVIIFIGGLYWLTKNRKPGEQSNALLNKVKTVIVNKPAATPTTPPEQKIKFDFYNILPKEQVNVNNTSNTSAPAKLQKVNTATYIVQIASLKNFSDADTLKAKLALNGFTAQVKAVVNSSGNTWYRVQIGPYSNFDDAFDAQNNLRKARFDGLIKKMS
jgi:cell division protein FtsN